MMENERKKSAARLQKKSTAQIYGRKRFEDRRMGKKGNNFVIRWIGHGGSVQRKRAAARSRLTIIRLNSKWVES